MSLNPPNPDCATCSFVMARVEIDSKLATVQHLVDILEGELGYNTEISIAFGADEIYSPDFDDNLGQRFSHFGISNESVITVTDLNDIDTRVTLEVLILER